MGAPLSLFPVEARTIAPPNDVHPKAVIATTDAATPAQTANSRQIDGLEIAQIPTMHSCMPCHQKFA